MSPRSMIRARSRELERSRRRAAAATAAATVGAGALLAAGTAQADTFQVTNLNDSGAGSLRQAVEGADANGAGSDTITFASTLSGTIRLTGGELEIDSAMDIQGPGADKVAVSGDANDDGIPNAGDYRVANVTTDNVGAKNDPVSISGLTLTEGFDPGDGGAVVSFYSNLTLDGVVVSDSKADRGGGVYGAGSRVTILDSTIAGNQSANNGGGAYIDDDASSPFPTDFVMRRSIVADNLTQGNGGGLYVDNQIDSITIADSTLTRNTSADTAGGLLIYGPSEDAARVSNSTLTGNVAVQGGAIEVYNVYDKPVFIENSTIADNTATALGGGIYRYGNGGADDATLSSTIVAGNAAPAGPDLAVKAAAGGAFEAGHSLIGNAAGSGPITQIPAGTNKIGVNPQLAPLADNGGPTPTMALPLTSPAIDAGISNMLSTDQRGQPRTVEVPAVPNAAGSDGTDIGAYEYTDIAVKGAQLEAQKKQKVKGKKVKLKVTVSADQPVDVGVTGKIKAKKKSYALKAANKSIPADKGVTLTLKPKGKKASKKIAKVLKKGKQAKAKVTATFTNEAGTSVNKNAKVTLKGKKKKKKK